jgi:hypothetical protein
MSIDDLVGGSGDPGGWRGDLLIRLFNYHRRKGVIGNANVLTCLLGRQPTTMVEYIDRMLTI